MFFYRFLFFILLSSIFWFALVFGQMGNPSKMSQWVFDAYEKKERLSKKIVGKKIIVVAGSNALFGVDSKILSHAFNLPVLNYGVNAGVELPCTLFLAKEVINKGDVVLMPLEYPMYSYDGTAGVQMIDYFVSRKRELFFELTLYEQFYMLWHIKLKRVWDGYFNQSTTKVSSGLYGAHHIDENGNQTKTDVKFRSVDMFNEVLKHTREPEKYGAEFDRDALGWSYLEEFVKWCEEREVRVIFMPSTLLKSATYFSDKKERWFYEHIADEVRRRGWVYVGEPYEYMYEKEFYFNTDFHLVDRGREIRTFKMVEDLRKVFGGLCD